MPKRTRPAAGYLRSSHPRRLRSAVHDSGFLVDFELTSHQDLFHRYFRLKEELERLVRIEVYLVMVGAMKNPCFVELGNQTRQLVHVAAFTRTD